MQKEFILHVPLHILIINYFPKAYLLDKYWVIGLLGY